VEIPRGNRPGWRTIRYSECIANRSSNIQIPRGVLMSWSHSGINRARGHEWPSKVELATSLAIIHTFAHSNARWSRGAIERDCVSRNVVNVFLVIGSRNGKTTGRLDSSTLQRIVLFRHSPFCLEMSGHPVTSLCSLVYPRLGVYLAASRFTRLRAV
jgi:hypothetical protein